MKQYEIISYRKYSCQKCMKEIIRIDGIMVKALRNSYLPAVDCCLMNKKKFQGNILVLTSGRSISVICSIVVSYSNCFNWIGPISAWIRLGHDFPDPRGSQISVSLAFKSCGATWGNLACKQGIRCKNSINIWQMISKYNIKTLNMAISDTLSFFHFHWIIYN